MSKKSTLLKLVNEIENVKGAMEDWELLMGDMDSTKGNPVEMKSPTDHSVRMIMDFARSYNFVQTRTLRGVDMFLN